MRKKHGESEFNRLFNSSGPQAGVKIFPFPKTDQVADRRQTEGFVSTPTAGKEPDTTIVGRLLADPEGY